MLSPRHKSGEEYLFPGELHEAGIGHSSATTSDIGLPCGGLVSCQIHLNAAYTVQAVPSCYRADNEVYYLSFYLEEVLNA